MALKIDRVSHGGTAYPPGSQTDAPELTITVSGAVGTEEEVTIKSDRILLASKKPHGDGTVQITVNNLQVGFYHFVAGQEGQQSSGQWTIEKTS
ncbi:hypothetical protein [Pseudomonas sp. CBZ-4]|uniref:hypothetical protein n=1 Tax=Pseudomonas sp. CBZ-4 TaxID=1163065 RepID=UPI00037A5D8D|nr:hypothetical protein [Pseudomonas sp. CBZ-4]